MAVGNHPVHTARAEVVAAAQARLAPGAVVDDPGHRTRPELVDRIVDLGLLLVRGQVVSRPDDGDVGIVQRLDDAPVFVEVIECGPLRPVQVQQVDAAKPGVVDGVPPHRRSTFHHPVPHRRVEGLVIVASERREPARISGVTLTE